MEHGSENQGKTQAERMRNPLCQCQRLVDLYQPLLRIPKIPQRQGVINTTHHASILPIEKDRRVVLLGVVERDALSKMGMRISD